VYRDRMYEPDEVRRILREAAERQDADRAKGEAGDAGGRPMTLDEIATLARDAGIREDLVRRAAEGPAPRAPLARARGNLLTGAPMRVVVERAVAGTVGPANHAQLVGRMRRALGEAGRSEVLGDTLSWSTTVSPTGAGRNVHVSIEPDADGRVTVRIDERMTPLAGAFFGGVFGGMGGGGMGLVLPASLALLPASMLPFVIAVWLVGSFALARALYVWRVRAREAELTALLDDLAQRISAAPAPVEPRARVAPKVRVEREEEQAQAEAEAEAEASAQVEAKRR
jgi:hypothetical protein